MPLDPATRSRLITWGAQLLLAVLVALLARWNIPVEVPPLPPITVVVSPGEPGHEATVKVFRTADAP